MTVETGFRFIRRERTMEIEEAKNFLCSELGRKCTTALREDSHAVLSWHVVRCPFCGKDRNVLSLENERTEADGHSGRHVHRLSGKPDKEAVLEWASPQESFFPETLELNRVHVPAELICRCCGMRSEPADGSSRVSVRSGHGKITVRCEVAEELSVLMYYLLRSRARDADQITLRKQRERVDEVLVFNLRKRRVYLEAYISGERILVYDLTYSAYETFARTAVCRLLQVVSVRRTIVKAFQEHYGRLPFSEKALTPESIIRLGHYGPFPLSFFEEMPLNNTTGTLDRSFRAAERFLTPGKAPELLQRSSLPKTKAIRRTFYENPCLFFYLREAELLWDAVRNQSCFHFFLADRASFVVLDLLHRSPATIVFFRDYIGARQTVSLLTMAAYETGHMRNYAASYTVMEPRERILEQKQWGKRTLQSTNEAGYYVPHRIWRFNAWNDCVDGYRFAVLTRQEDFEQAASDLHNCLATWRIHHTNPVIGVTRGDRYVAAIEMGMGQETACIVQAKISHNLDISRGAASLFAAFQKWMTKNELSFFDDEFELDWEFGIEQFR